MTHKLLIVLFIVPLILCSLSIDASTIKRIELDAFYSTVTTFDKDFEETYWAFMSSPCFKYENTEWTTLKEVDNNSFEGLDPLIYLTNSIVYFKDNVNVNYCKVYIPNSDIYTALIKNSKQYRFTKSDHKTKIYNTNFSYERK